MLGHPLQVLAVVLGQPALPVRLGGLRRVPVLLEPGPGLRHVLLVLLPHPGLRACTGSGGGTW
ncbi:hypothetical protein ACFQ0M_06460 [Kitasatospora aburaviensis]